MMPFVRLSLVFLAIVHFCHGQDVDAEVLQPMTAFHSIAARQVVYNANVNGQLAATCDVCERPGANVSIYWGRDDTTTGVFAFVIGGKIKYPKWTSLPPEVVPGVTCGDDNTGVRYVVKLLADSLAVPDSGRWWCQLLPNDKFSDWRFAYFSINVYGSLSPAEDLALKANDTLLSPSSSISIIEGSTTKLECQVSTGQLNSNQNMTVNWQVEGESTFLAQDQPVLDYVASVDHFGKQLACVVEYFGAPPMGKAKPIVRRVGLDMVLRPRVTISAWGPSGMSVSSTTQGNGSVAVRSVLVDEGQNVDLQCSPFNSLFHNNRALTGKEQYRWFLTEPNEEKPIEITQGQGKRVLTIGPLDRNRDGVVVRCDVDNGQLNSSASLHFSVQYKLASSSEAMFVGATRGEMVTLDCTEGDPDADRFVERYQFTWFFGRLQIMTPPSTSTTGGEIGRFLTFKLSNSSQFGSYRCLARNTRSGLQAARTFFILEKGKPQASSSISVVDAIPRYSASIRCSTFGLPRPTSFRWFRRLNASEDSPGFEIFDDNERFRIEQRNTSSAITESTLLIRQVDEIDFGRYICAASNDFGTVESVYLLARQESFPTIEIIAGVCAGSFILAILVAVAVYFKCRRIKGNDSGANSLKLSETASSGSHNDSSSSTSSGGSDRDRRRDSITSPTYTVDVIDKSSPGVATISHSHLNLHPPTHSRASHPPQQAPPQQQQQHQPQGGYAIAHAITLPSLPSLLPSYHRYPDSVVDALPPDVNSNGLVRLSTSVNDNFDDWLKQSRLATFSHLGAYQPSVSFRHPLPPLPVSNAATSNGTPSLTTEQSRLATDV